MKNLKRKIPMFNKGERVIAILDIPSLGIYQGKNYEILSSRIITQVKKPEVVVYSLSGNGKNIREVQEKYLKQIFSP